MDRDTELALVICSLGLCGTVCAGAMTVRTRRVTNGRQPFKTRPFDCDFFAITRPKMHYKLPHYPLCLLDRSRNQKFLVTLTAWSMVITLVVMRSRGSAVAAMLFHASANVCAFTMWEPDAWVFALGPWVVAAAIASWRLRMRAEAQPIKTYCA